MKKWLLAAAAVCVLISGCSRREEESWSDREVETTAEGSGEKSTEGTAGSESEHILPSDDNGGEETREGDQEKSTEEEPWDGDTGRTILLASDIHYLARQLTDFQQGFTYRVEHGDGKIVPYIWEITDAFIQEVKETDPDLVVLSGDLTYNGERASHEELADHLKEIEDSGIPVAVIPGNHDINNTAAAQFVGEMAPQAEYIQAEDFEEIYYEFGYEEAISRDPASLSYVYPVDEITWALMLDTCQYEPYNQVGGMISNETYHWIEEQLELAWDQGIHVIPIGHHNLLDESEIYVEDCTIEHSERLIEMLEGWEVLLFLSGHLHVQHFMQSGDGEGIYEIVSSSLATSPCQYGILHYGDDGSFEYKTKALDMESWAKARDVTDSNLLNFTEFRDEFLYKVFYNQAQDEFSQSQAAADYTDYERHAMADVYAALKVAYYAGKAAKVIDQVETTQGYDLWLQRAQPGVLYQYIEFMVADGKVDYNYLRVE